MTGRRKCITCAHPDRKEIDRQLAAGASPTKIARQYRTSRDSMRRHALNHLGYLVELALKGEYHGSILGVRSLTITTRTPAADDEK